MGTIWIREFTGGLDTRRLPETSPGGTLIRATNCHINRGGEIEQRAKFVKAYTLPPGQTVSLAADEDGLVVFSHTTRPASLDAAIGFRRLQHPSALALSEVRHWTLYGGEVHCTGQFSNGTRYIFAGNTRVSDANAPPNLANSGNPLAVLTKDTKLYAGSLGTLYFSAIGDATDFGAGAGLGDGFLVVSTYADGFSEITGLARYDENMAIFSPEAIQIFFTDPDEDLNRSVQLLNNTGCPSPRAVTQFGDGDLFYLDRSGIRSLRARNSSNSAATTDVGSAIDTLVTAAMRTAGAALTNRAIGIIEPRDGRLWLAIDQTIYVFSYFSASKISAWSVYDPGFQVQDMVVWDQKVWIRSNDEIWVYGGTGTEYEYDASAVVQAWLPYLDANDPTRKKDLTGIDAAVRGTWKVDVAMDPNDQSVSDEVARINRTTFPGERIMAQGEFSHLSLRFTSQAPPSATEPAVLSQAVIHFTGGAEEDS
jgi:hypothetical protein